MAEAFGIACHELVNLDFRCGSKPEVQPRSRERLFLGVKQTKSAQKQTWGLNVGCWGMSGRTGGMVGESVVSQEQKSAWDTGIQ